MRSRAFAAARLAADAVGAADFDRNFAEELARLLPDRAHLSPVSLPSSGHVSQSTSNEALSGERENRPQLPPGVGPNPLTTMPTWGNFSPQAMMAAAAVYAPARAAAGGRRTDTPPSQAQ